MLSVGIPNSTSFLSFLFGVKPASTLCWLALSPVVLKLEEVEADLGLWKCIFIALCMAEAGVALAHTEGGFACAPGAGVGKVHSSPLVLQSP